MAFVFNEKRFLRIQRQKEIQRRSAYEAYEREFAEIRAEALPVLELLQVLDVEDLRYEFLRLKFNKLEQRAAQISKVLQRKKQRDIRKAEEAEKKQKAREAEIDQYTDDDEDRTPAFFIKEPGSPARDQGNSGFASRGGGGGCGGGIASSGGGAGRGGGIASRGGGLASRGGGLASRGGGLASRGGGIAYRGGGFASRGGYGQSTLIHQRFSTSPPPKRADVDMGDEDDW